MLSYFKLSEEHVLSPDPRWLVELERRDRQWFGRAWSDGEYPLPQMQALRVKPRQIEQLHHIIRHWEATALTRDDAPISPWNLVYRLDGKAIHKTGFAHPSTWNQLIWLCREVLPVPFLWQSSLRKAELSINGMGHMRMLADGPRGILSVSSRRPEVSISRTDSDACMSALEFMEGFLDERPSDRKDGPALTLTYHPIDKPSFSLKRRFSTGSMPEHWQSFATFFEKLTTLPPLAFGRLVLLRPSPCRAMEGQGILVSGSMAHPPSGGDRLCARRRGQPPSRRRHHPHPILPGKRRAVSFGKNQMHRRGHSEVFQVSPP